MITLGEFRDRTRHLPPDTEMGISFDEEANEDVIALRVPGSTGMETLVDCGTLDPVDCDEEG